MSQSTFSDLFYFVHADGRKLFPCKMKNRDTGRLAFRVSQGGTGGNTKEAGLEVEDEHEMRTYVLEKAWGVRAKEKKPGGVPNLYFPNGRTIVRIEEK